MSKASEWAKIRTPKLVLPGGIEARAGKEYDDNPGMALQETDRPTFVLERQLQLQPFYVALPVQDALRLAHWVIDTFGEGSA